jgi:hypothetical protein
MHGSSGWSSNLSSGRTRSDSRCALRESSAWSEATTQESTQVRVTRRRVLRDRAPVPALHVHEAGSGTTACAIASDRYLVEVAELLRCETSYFFLAASAFCLVACLAAMSCFFLLSELAVLACFWEFFFCVAFGDLSPMVLLRSWRREAAGSWRREPRLVRRVATEGCS